MQYLLKINGFDLKSSEINTNLNQSFLNKQFEYYNKLSKIQKNKDNTQNINLFYKEINQIKKKYIQKILKKFNKKSWEKAFIIFQKILFLHNFKKKIK